mgnify:CR=1 FL=1
MLGIGNLAKKVFGTPNDRKVKSVRPLVAQINAQFGLDKPLPVFAGEQRLAQNEGQITQLNRRGGGTAFWGCTRFPDCRTTLPMRAG